MTQIIREIPANAVYKHGGLINGIPPIVPDDVFMRDYQVVSCEPAINRDAFRVVYEVPDTEVA